MAVSTIDPNGLNIGQIGGTRNKIINGAMTIDQRNAGAAVTAGSSYTLDRWNVDRVWSGSTVTIQQSSTAPTGFSNSLLATVSTGAASASGSYFSIQQFVEGYNIIDLALGTAGAKTFTVSFWVRSSVTGTFGVCIRNSAFNLSYCTTYTISAADTWEYKTVTVAAPTSGTFGTGNSYGINVIFSLGGGADVKPASNDAWVSGSFLSPIGQTDLIATTGATFYITGVQLEAGDTATPFEHRSYGAELALCQRYYFDNKGPSGAYTSWGSSGGYGALSYPFKASMRANPTIVVSALTAGSLLSSPTANTESVNFFTQGLTGNSASGVTFTASAEL